MKEIQCKIIPEDGEVRTGVMMKDPAMTDYEFICWVHRICPGAYKVETDRTTSKLCVNAYYNDRVEQYYMADVTKHVLNIDD